MGRVFSRRPKLIRSTGNTAELPQDAAAYLADSYPHNHNMAVTTGGLVAGRRLARRLKTITGHYPQRFSSFVDLSCSKGFFVLDAAQRPHCDRALGIDIDRREIQASEAARDFVGAANARYAQQRLHELAEGIQQAGGPFDVAVLLNTYPYLIFGSGRSPLCYEDHEEIFRLLRKVCSGRLLFSNRTELDQLTEATRTLADQRPEKAANYSTDHILGAASRYFRVHRGTKINRLPIWIMDAEGPD